MEWKQSECGALHVLCICVGNVMPKGCNRGTCRLIGLVSCLISRERCEEHEAYKCMLKFFRNGCHMVTSVALSCCSAQPVYQGRSSVTCGWLMWLEFFDVVIQVVRKKAHIIMERRDSGLGINLRKKRTESLQIKSFLIIAIDKNVDWSWVSREASVHRIRNGVWGSSRWSICALTQKKFNVTMRYEMCQQIQRPVCQNPRRFESDPQGAWMDMSSQVLLHQIFRAGAKWEKKNSEDLLCICYSRSIKAVMCGTSAWKRHHGQFRVRARKEKVMPGGTFNDWTYSGKQSLRVGMFDLRCESSQLPNTFQKDITQAQAA